MFCALREWQSGKHDALTFMENVYKPIYEEFKANLQGLMAATSEGRGKLASRRKTIAREGL